MRSHMFCAYTNKFVKYQEEEEKKGGVPDLSNLIQLVSVQRRQDDPPPPHLASWNCEKSPSISLHLRLHPGSPELPHEIGNSFRNDLLLFVKEIINKRRKEKVVLVEKNLVPELIFVATIATSGRGIFFLAKFHSLTV